MKGKKDEAKVMGPLFPRLRVNDTKKGGPRAPPRNKMALYEQLSVPSQRFKPLAGSAFPPLSCNTSTLVPLTSSSQGLCHKRTSFSPFYIHAPTTTHLSEKIHSHSPDRMEKVEVERHMRKSMSNKESTFTGQFSSAAECNLFHAIEFCKSKTSNGNKYRDDHDFVVLTFVHSEMDFSSSRDQHGGKRERPTPSMVTKGNNMAAACNSLVQLQKAHDELMKQTSIMDKNLRQLERNPSEQKQRETASIRDRLSNSGSEPLTGENFAEPSRNVNAFFYQEHFSGSETKFGSLQNRNSQLHQETSTVLLPQNNDCHDVDAFAERDASGTRNDWCSRDPLENSHRCVNEAEMYKGEDEKKASESVEAGDEERNDDISETSMIDPISRFEVSPDDIVGVIGQQHFLKARKEIVNQQRIFAAQVFELHRLIMVQKLIAGSPDLLHEDNPYLGRASSEVPAKKLRSNYLLESQPLVVKQKDDSHKASKDVDNLTESAVRKSPPAPSQNDSTKHVHVSKNSSCGIYSRNPPAAPMATDNKSGAWYFHPPPGNQWLIRVMSPTEGLVYKPYSSPFAQTTCFMPSAYGGYGPFNLPPIPTYGLPASHNQPVAPNYFHPYGVPVANPITAAVKQVNTLGGIRQPHEQAEQISMREVNFNIQSGSSCDVLNQKSEAFSCCVGKFRASEDSELQGSSASSPCVDVAGQVVESHHVLPLFPVTPTTEHSDRSSQAPSNDQQPRVIKVVPHNRRFATESAALIFHSIQEERLQYDSL